MLAIQIRNYGVSQIFASQRVLDTFDSAIVEKDLEREYEVIPTTCDRSLADGLWFAVYAAFHPTIELNDVVYFSLEMRDISKDIEPLLDRFRQGWVPPESSD